MTSDILNVFTVKNLKLETDNDFCLSVDKFEVRQGDLVGIVGANGSGKTSFIEAVLGLRETVSGEVSLFGRHFRAYNNKEVKLTELGVQLQTVTYPDNYKVCEIVDLHFIAYGMQDKEIYSLLELDKVRNNKYVKLSRGQKQRVDLFIAFAHSPSLLILDEPSTGLDQVFKSVFNRLLDQRSQDSTKTTVIVTHTGPEIVLCNKILWFKTGQVCDYLESEHPNKRAVIKQTFDISCPLESKEPLSNILSNHVDVSYFCENGFNAFTVFGSDLQALKTQLTKQSELTYSDIRNTDGYEFLRFVSDESVVTPKRQNSNE